MLLECPASLWERPGWAAGEADPAASVVSHGGRHVPTHGHKVTYCAPVAPECHVPKSSTLPSRGVACPALKFLL